MHVVVNTAVTNYVNWKNSILEFWVCRQLRDNKRLVNNRTHGNGVVARFKGKIEERRISEVVTFAKRIKSYVTLCVA